MNVIYPIGLPWRRFALSECF